MKLPKSGPIGFSEISKMVSLKVQKRLSAKVLKCGKGRIWMDPNEATEIGLAKSRRSVKKLAKDGYIVKKQTVTHSRSKATQRCAGYPCSNTSLHSAPYQPKYNLLVSYRLRCLCGWGIVLDSIVISRDVIQDDLAR